ncbi:polysaccharide pyruvyl transferase family protein [uncultured Polaribacter sp.]|uniref:polysaccharide pyruvyl transferase family protein n=1 Tax=uncultured Polaribacter sp. TaxID=174711 RepID=UPI002630B942|nr:polysaccharide pyruvyl transferase family protein [uncultured Polaribacter sp.]
MKIVIIGWYGTETIGDRAILAGLISFFNKAFNKFEIQLGSLYPFFSERTVNEDYSFLKEIIKKDLSINIFNTQNSKELIENIKESDLVVIGGGPLMDLNELYMLEYSFKIAKKNKIKTAILGCGIGPLFNKGFRKSVLNIVNNSDLVILRDSKSKDNLSEIFKEFKVDFDPNNILTSFDPAVECTLEFNKIHKKNNEDYIAVNLREFPLEYNTSNNINSINEDLKIFIKDLAVKFSDREIRLIPMHYFHIGGDDRVFLNKILLDIEKENVIVQNSNLTLKETISVFSNSYFNVGMRFHSVVLQTIVSGKNYVLDYTEPKRGKIYGFIRDIDTINYYDKRYISLQEDDINIDIIRDIDDEFLFNTQDVKMKLDIYINNLKKIS